MYILATVLNSVKSYGDTFGIAALLLVVTREVINRKKRAAEVTSSMLDSDKKRVALADGIANKLQQQLTSQAVRINNLEERERFLLHKVYLLERILILNNIELPYKDMGD
jgi:hypothetical protein